MSRVLSDSKSDLLTVMFDNQPKRSYGIFYTYRNGIPTLSAKEFIGDSQSVFLLIAIKAKPIKHKRDIFFNTDENFTEKFLMPALLTFY